MLSDDRVASSAKFVKFRILNVGGILKSDNWNILPIKL